MNSKKKYRNGEINSFEEERRFMVANHLAARGIVDPSVLQAFESVPREAFVPKDLVDFAYYDTPLSIAKGQTISQPFIVALMTEALELKPQDRVLEIGTGSGYAAAIISCLAQEVFTIERHQVLADTAQEKLKALGYDNVHVLCGDGTLGWPDYAPFDAIVVAAGGPEVPQSLLSQLAIGGRLIIPVGEEERTQKLQRIIREDRNSYKKENLGAVRFVPLIGEEGWQELLPTTSSKAVLSSKKLSNIHTLMKESVTPIETIENVDLGVLLERIGDSRVVLIGEATHGTSEFYQMRAEITKELIAKKGFQIVAIEGDWPDAAQINRYLRGQKALPSKWAPFTRFPTWMWRNREVVSFLEWLHNYNSQKKEKSNYAGFYGLDLYSLYSSIDAVLAYLETVDLQTAKVARERYGCLSPWQKDPASYGRAAITGQYKNCEKEVVSMLQQMLEKRLEYQPQDPTEYFDALQNSRVIVNAERYYRAMYYAGAASWNLRDRHMFDTLLSLLSFHGTESKAVVWAHNSHVGDASATEMSVRGEFNIGQLCRSEFGNNAFTIGFGTHQGVVAAATDWGGEMELKKIRPSHAGSYERLCHEVDRKSFFLHLREPVRTELRDHLMEPRLSRAIGVIYRPETELQSHYYQSILPLQFDEYIWFDETSAVHPFDHPIIHGLPETFPSGL